MSHLQKVNYRMIIIPAVDIRQGKCVRLTQGKIDQETIYSNDPVFIAKMWQAKGAKRLHIIDLDGAFSSKTQSIEILENIRKSVDAVIQFGGGVRSIEIIDQLVKLGIDKIILGTIIIYNPDIVRKAVSKYGEKIIATVDVINDKVAIGGWKEITEVESADILDRISKMDIKELIVTDIAKDGAMKGPNVKMVEKIAKSTDLRVIASGGISSLEDINKIKKLKKHGVIGMIIGKALYNETIKFEDALLGVRS